MNDKSFWYIACESKDLTADKPVARKLLDEWIVLFRDEDGNAAALQDRCLHRSSQLSRGQNKSGCIKCPYHGWTYDRHGEVVDIPAETGTFAGPRKKALAYPVREQQGYIYICLSPTEANETTPFSIPYYEEMGYAHIRLINRFQNNVTNCVENFVDIPHTIFVHPTIFRIEKPRKQRMAAHVCRENGSVIVRYKMETDNFGAFSWFLNPKGNEIIHIDSFHMPNITHVEYIFGPKRHFNIISQSIPIGPAETLVYTDLTYNYGHWNLLAKPIIRMQAQKIIDQDIEVLNNQWKTIEKYGPHFVNSPIDIIHLLIESVRNELAKDRDPRRLEKRSNEVEFWI
jgi:phenylpropionate dioxygenase-like ring-hydroxylating dioxygenase large terminal subunit